MKNLSSSVSLWQNKKEVGDMYATKNMKNIEIHRKLGFQNDK